MEVAGLSVIDTVIGFVMAHGAELVGVGMIVGLAWYAWQRDTIKMLVCTAGLIATFVLGW